MISTASEHLRTGGLSRGYLLEIDGVVPEEWDEHLARFADASIFQTHAYGQARWGENKLSRIVLRKHGRIVALAQAALLKFPVVGGGVAYVSKGPAWQLHGEIPDLDHLRQMAASLRQEFAVHRGLMLKVVPNLLAGVEHPALEIFQSQGYHWRQSSYRTLVVDLSLPLADLRAGLRQSWRKMLNKAEKRDIELVEGTDQSLYEEGLKIHREMNERKNYAEFVDMAVFGEMQRALLDRLKMRILLCKYEGAAVAALAWSTFGETGLPLLGATRPKALEIGASYLMFWRMIQWLKAAGFRYCDLAGINPERNPGSYVFKSGMAKRNAAELRGIGEFEVCERPLLKALYTGAATFRGLARKTRLFAEKLSMRRKQPLTPAAELQND